MTDRPADDRRSLSPIDRAAMAGVARAETQHQMTRPFSRGLRGSLTTSQQQAVESMIHSAVVGAIEAWEAGRASREKEKFYAA